MGGRKVTVFDQLLDEDTSVATIVVRASTENLMNDVERALDDGIHSVRTLCLDPRLLPGAGAVELELTKLLRRYADEEQSLDQYAIRKFADAFDVVPRTLAENSGADPTNTMHNLHLAHKGAYVFPFHYICYVLSIHYQFILNYGLLHVVAADGTASMGFDILECKPLDALETGIYDLYATKVNALRLAVDAALTVLRVDQIVMSKPAGGPKPKAGGPMDE